MLKLLNLIIIHRKCGIVLPGHPPHATHVASACSLDRRLLPRENMRSASEAERVHEDSQASSVGARFCQIVAVWGRLGG